MVQHEATAMIHLLPGDIGAVYGLDKTGYVKALEWVLSAGKVGPDHVFVIENDTTDLNVLCAKQGFIREAVPGHGVIVARLSTAYGELIKSGKIRVEVYRLREWIPNDVRRGLIEMRQKNHLGMQYDFPRLFPFPLPGFIPSKQKRVCTMPCRDYIEAASRRPVESLNKKRDVSAMPTLSPLHIVSTSQLRLLGEYRWMGCGFEIRSKNQE